MLQKPPYFVANPYSTPEEMTMTDNEIKSDYIRRMNNVLSFIDDNLDAALSLESVSEIAHYSPYHFHRIFKAITNETLNSYIGRKRIEKAASVLIRKKEVTITELSLQYGFNSNSSFTRAFKNFYGISPTEFRKQSPGRFSKISKTDRKNGQAIVVFEEYVCNINNHIKWMNMNAAIEIKELPAMSLAYISHVGDYNLEGTFEKLLKWAGPKGLLDVPDIKMLVIYHDSFKITAPDKVRMSACILLKEPVKPDGEVGLTTINKGKFVVGHFEVPAADLEKAWSGMFVWLNEHGYKVTERPCFDILHNDFRKHPEKKFIVDLCIPLD
jgi:AraC family transcriptional regulator